MAGKQQTQRNLDSFVNKDLSNMDDVADATWKETLSKKVSASKTINDLKAVLAEVIDVTNSIYKENTKLKTEIASLKSDTQKNTEFYDEELKNLQVGVKKSAQYSELSSTMDKLDDLDNRLRRNNIRVVGVPEGQEKDYGGTDSFLQHFIKDKLNIQLAPESIQRSHRISIRGASDQPRPIVARFLYFKEKEQVLKAASKQKPKISGRNVYLNNDFSNLVVQKRKALYPLMMEKRNNNQRAWLNHDKLLYIEGGIIKALRIDSDAVRERKKD